MLLEFICFIFIYRFIIYVQYYSYKFLLIQNSVAIHCYYDVFYLKKAFDTY